ncbi:hypothetical protein BDV12DRAFT_211223 [Aspergillus spectabilis]
MSTVQPTNSGHSDDLDLQEPIAVCGLAFKFPQNAVSEDAFWRMLMERGSARTEYPPSRLNIDALYHPSRPNALCTRTAHFLSQGLSHFDADFFSISPPEAAAMDPMQRLLLETTVEALDSAGIRLEDLRGSRTSVHTGCFSNDYLHQLLKDPQRLPPYAAVAASQSMLANRISWFFDLRGPSCNIDSACSSSALAIESACRLLLSGQTDMGLAAGCNLIIDPDYGIILSNSQMLSPDGRCYTFDNRANGYARGEGVAVVILKRLSDAIRDNDTIRAVIRGAASNQDGRTPSITQPNREAQAQLIRETYASAGLAMRHTRFFEAHGTGTPIGDSTEVAAIAECFSGHRSPDSPLFLGAVKTNIGHLEGASGIAGFIKAILAVERGVIPPNTNFESLNSKLTAFGSCVAVPPGQGVPWPDAEIRRVSINSFGYGGASFMRRHGLQGNYRTTPDDETARLETNGDKNPDVPRLLVWSAASRTSLVEMLKHWGNYCCERRQRQTDDWQGWGSHVAYTLDSRRSMFPWRSYGVILSSTDFDHLGTLVSSPQKRTTRTPRLAFIFTGLGAQWYAMGRELLRYPVFSHVLQEADALYRELGCSWSAIGEFLKHESDSSINEPHLAQALTATLQIGLVDLLNSFQVRPVAVVGHSMGEIAAAYCAGFISRQSALRLAYYRGLFFSVVTKRDTRRGAMLAVGASVTAVEPYLARLRRQPSAQLDLVVACLNSPISTTISGAETQIEALRQILEADGIFARRLKVSAAHHSPQMEQIKDDCLRHFRDIQRKSPTTAAGIQMISTVTGMPLDGDRARQGRYWIDNMLSPVLFSQAVQRLCRDGTGSLREKTDYSQQGLVVDHLVEIGPHAALRLPIHEIMDTLPARGDMGEEKHESITYLPTLIRAQSASKTLLSLIGRLYCAGLSTINLRAVNEPAGDPPRNSRMALVDAPAYPFDHHLQHWSESVLSRNYRLRPHGRLALLGSPSQEWNPAAPSWRCCVRSSEMPWLLDHSINKKPIYPAAAMLVMAIQAVTQVVAKDTSAIAGFQFRSVRFRAPISVGGSEKDKSLETRMKLDPARIRTDVSRWAFTIYSMTGEDKWLENCQGTVEVHYTPVTPAAGLRIYQQRWESCLERCTAEMETAQVYTFLKLRGLDYGPSLQGITAPRVDGVRTATTILDLSRPLDASPEHEEYISVHPASLDAVFQLTLVALSAGGSRSIPTQAISAIDRLWISRSGIKCHDGGIPVLAQVDEDRLRTKVYSAFALSADKQNLVLSVDRLETTVISATSAAQRAIAAVSSDSDKNTNWHTIHSEVDVELEFPERTLQRLESLCGIEHQPSVSPREFLRDVRLYLTIRLHEIRAEIDVTTIPVDRAHLQKYLTWMDMKLAQQQHDLDYVDESTKTQLRSRIQQQGALGRFFVTVADKVPGVLEGSVDAVQLLFEGHIVEEFYRNPLASSAYLQKLERYVRDLSFKRPNMDILEVGAGTGSFTQHILNGLCYSRSSYSSHHGAEEITTARFRSYCFTDISPAFFERAGSLFRTHGRKIAFRILDADMDPLEQGFIAASFDTIVASNVLHVTKGLRRTLLALRTLLRPGGKFILHEVTRPEAVEVGFVFGLLPGWWPDVTDGRTLSPVVTEGQWDALLRESGFSGAEMVTRDHADVEAHVMSMVYTTAVKESTSSGPGLKYGNGSSLDVDIVFEASSEVQMQTARRLEHALAGYHCLSRLVVYPDEIDLIMHQGVIISLLDIEAAVLSRLDSERSFTTLRRMFMRPGRILWLSGGGASTTDPQFGMIDGFAQVFRIENPQARFKILKFDVVEGPQQPSGVHIVTAALRQLLDETSPSYLEDYSVVSGEARVRRILAPPSMQVARMEKISGIRTITEKLIDVRPFGLSVQAASASQHMKIIRDNDDDIRGTVELGSDEVQIEVHCIAFNHEQGLGFQCAGQVINAGRNSHFLPDDRVCAYYYSTDHVLKSTIHTHQRLVARIPNSLSFRSASLLPRDLLVASYLAQLIGPSSSRGVVMIHAGQTRLAQAVILQMRKRFSDVFVTVHSSDIVKDVFETLVGKDNVFTLSSTVAAHFRLLCPQGADTVLDLADSDLVDILDQVSIFGAVIRVRNSPDGSSEPEARVQLPANIAFQTIEVGEVLRGRAALLQMPAVIPSIFLTEEIQVLQVSDIVAESSSHLDGFEPRGAVIEFDNQENVTISQPLQSSPLFNAATSYIVVGGLGDLGCCIVKWMVKRGARHLILLSRAGPRTQRARSMIRDLEAAGVDLYLPLCDIVDRVALETVLRDCAKKMPPIKGCIQAAGALRDITYSQMTFSDWRYAIEPKVIGSWNLHSLLPEKLDFFILTSSLTGLIGNGTQINYAAANTYQDALARYRLSLGQKAVSLDLGILLTGGLVSQSEGLVDRLLATNVYFPLPEPEILALFEYFCDPQLALSDTPAQVATGFIWPSPGAERTYTQLPFTLDQPFWNHMLSTASDPQHAIASSATDKGKILHEALEQAAHRSIDELSSLITEALVKQFCQMVLVSRDKLDLTQPLRTAGADSLTAVNLRSWILKNFEVDLPVFDILGEMSVVALGGVIAREWKSAAGVDEGV